MNQTSNNSILLIGINAKYIHSNPAIYSLKAYADKYYPDRPGGCAVEIAEYTINQPQSAILADIYQKRPQAAAFSCYIWNGNIVQICSRSCTNCCPTPRSGLADRRFLITRRI